MIEIDCVALQAKELEKRKKEPPLLEVTFGDDDQVVDHVHTWHQRIPAGVAYDLWDEMIRVKKERDILSSRTAKLVDDTIEALKQENPAAADAFLAGELAVEEIAEHYRAIQGLTDKAMQLYDRIEHIEKYGNEDPRKPEAAIEDDDRVDAIKQKIRRLDDAIFKTKKKLQKGQAKNPARLAMWREKLSLDEARRDELKAQLKRLQYEARAKRSGEG